MAAGADSIDDMGLLRHGAMDVLVNALGVAAIPAAGLLHPAGRVEDARLPGVERVARRRDLDIHDGIGAASCR